VPGTDVPATEFRDAMGHFTTGVTVITSIGADGTRVGTTANAVTSLSLDPPLILVCFDLGSTTLRAIRGHGAFVVNVLAAGQEHLSAGFARRGLAAAWDGVRHRRGPTGSPRLDGVLAVVECTVEHSLPPAGTTRSWSAACGTSRPAPPRPPRSSSSAAVTPRWPRSRPARRGSAAPR
jgi:3-hydroxy-9,10-secoandrosta-1,3,5(10)-triene-9,17-dione monooxygenase reductase component